MRDQELDRLFERFRRRGDLPALGAVFDATAPELLRVAMSLVRDPGEADDLVQETFLTAIQRAGRYDAGRRLVPWLLGILVHHAQERRRLRRRELDPTRLATRAPLAPEAEAGERELEAELERALAELSARERGVLEAYLRHGKGAAEIASETGAAPGAVRMQIHRGLDRLRKALPVGLALGGAAGAASAQGLAAVRSAVLRAGETAAKTLVAGGGSLLGAGTAGVLMAKKFVLAGIVAALAAGWFFLRSGDERAPGAAGDVARAETRAAPPAPASPLAEPARLPAEAPARTPVAEPPARVAAEPETDPDRAGLRGRVLEADGAPVVGMEVGLLQLDERELFPPELAAPGTSDPRLFAARARTDADGRFLLAGATVGALSALGLDLGGERASLRVLDAVLAPGATTDLGDVVLLPSGTLTGRVVDEDGNAVVGARVRVGPLPKPLARYGLAHVTAGSAIVHLERSGAVEAAYELPAWLSALEARLPFATTRTGSDGHFELARAAAGEPTVLVDAAGFARHVSQPVRIEPGARAELGELRLERGLAVHGRVLDAAGAPVAGAEVRAGLVTGDRELNVFAPSVACDAEGRFAVEHLPSGWTLGVIARRDPQGQWVAAQLRGAEHVAELPVERELVVEVVDRSGAPVPAPELFVRVVGPDGLGLFAPPLLPRPARALDAAEGRFSLGRLAPGSYLVAARAAGLAQAACRVTLAADTPPLRLVLGAVREVRVRVLDAETRAPLAGARVRVEEGERAPPAVLAAGHTDADGYATLALPRDDVEPRRLHAEHPRFTAAWRALDGTGVHELELGRGGRLVARLADPSLARERCMLVLELRSAPHGPLFPRLAGLAADGTLALEHLMPGTWRWTLMRSLASGEALAFLEDEDATEELARGEVTLAEGETTELVLGAPPARGTGAASLSGSVRTEGRPWGAVEVDLITLEGDGDVLATRGSGGRFRFEGAKPGRYLVYVRPADPPATLERGEFHVLAEEVVLTAGEERTLDLDVTPHEVEVRVLRVDGLPAEGVRVTLHQTKSAWVGRGGKTDAQGMMRLALPKGGAYRATAAHAEHGSGALDLVVEGVRGTVATIRLELGVECSGHVNLDPELRVPDGTYALWLESVGSRSECPIEVVRGSAPFRVAGLVPGNYDAWLQHGARLLHARLELPEGGARDLVLELEPQE